ncbi:MAG: hypothetical protein F6K10_14055 [Moorea sp. SIO2B7]|nr:hypothetical protein [Moorena sp. SIO2B7]
MLTKIITLASAAIAGYTIFSGYNQSSAFMLRQQTQTNHWPRHGTIPSGIYYGGYWQPLPNRSAYGGFRGGGPNSGK